MKYMKNNLDDIKIRVLKGMREQYRESAKSAGYESFNVFVICAIEEKMEREGGSNE